MVYLMNSLDQRIAKLKELNINKRVYNEPSRLFNYTTKSYDEIPLGRSFKTLKVEQIVNYVPLRKREKYWKKVREGNTGIKAYHLTFKPDYDKGLALSSKELNKRMKKAYSKEDIYS